MPIDARIPLGVTGLDPNGFTNALAAGMKMRQIQNESDRLAYKDEAAVAKSNALSKFYQSPRGPEDVATLAREAPDAVSGIEKNTREAQLAEIQAKKGKLEWAKGNHELLAQASAAILANPTRENANSVLDSVEAQSGDASGLRKQLNETRDEGLPGLFKGWGVTAQQFQQLALQEDKAGRPDYVQTPDGFVDRKNPQAGIIQVPGQGETPSAQRERHFQTQQEATDRRLAVQEERLADQQRRQQINDEVASGQRLTPADASKVQQKLVRIEAMKRQLALVKDTYYGTKDEKGNQVTKGVKGSFSAGPGAGIYAPSLLSGGGEKFDKAVASLASSKTAMLRTPGVGTMSDYDQKLDVADLPSRNTHEGTTEQQIQAYENMIADMETGYRALLAGPAQAPAGGGAAAPTGRPAPTMVPGADPGVTREEVEAEMRRRGLVLP